MKLLVYAITLVFPLALMVACAGEKNSQTNRQLVDGQALSGDDSKGEKAVCTQEYEPVCGVDGFNYSNMCELDKAGVDLDYEGTCEDLEDSNDDTNDSEDKDGKDADGDTEDEEEEDDWETCSGKDNGKGDYCEDEEEEEEEEEDTPSQND